MTYKIVIKQAALSDTQKAYNYYDGINAGLGERFLQQLETAYTSLTLYPTNFGFIDERKILRDRLLKVFPYSIIYKIEAETVVVVAIHNCYQHPAKKYRQ